MTAPSHDLASLLRADIAAHDRYRGKRDARPLARRLVGLVLDPYFAPVLLIRLAAWLHRRGGIADAGSLVVSRLNYTLFGLEVARQTEIGPGLFMPHTRGTVIGAASIGENAVIYHGVTLGARLVDVGFNSETRPVLGDDVVVGTGAVVIGGVRVGHGAKLGANAVITSDVPDGAVMVAPSAIPLTPSKSPPGS